MTNFMPDYYQEPKVTSGYMNPSKLEEGTYKIRVLSCPIVGWERWVNKKPDRYTFDNNPEEPGDDGRDPYIFTSMIVWNYTEEAIQIFTITQASLRKALIKFSEDPDFGPPFGYDLKLTKEGEGKNSKYMLVALAPSEVGKEIERAFREKPISLEALFACQDPFKPAKNGEITSRATQTSENGSFKLELVLNDFPNDRQLVTEFIQLRCAAINMREMEFCSKLLKDNAEMGRFTDYFDKWKAQKLKAKTA